MAAMFKQEPQEVLCGYGPVRRAGTGGTARLEGGSGLYAPQGLRPASKRWSAPSCTKVGERELADSAPARVAVAQLVGCCESAETSDADDHGRVKRARLAPRKDPVAETLASQPRVAEGRSVGASGSTDPVRVQSSQDFWRVQVEAIYRKRNPYKLSQVPALLAKYKGRETILYRKICRAYDLKDTVFYTSESAWEEVEREMSQFLASIPEKSSSMFQWLASVLGLSAAPDWRSWILQPAQQDPSAAAPAPRAPATAGTVPATEGRSTGARMNLGASPFAFRFSSGPSPALLGLGCGSGSAASPAIQLEPSSWLPLNIDGGEADRLGDSGAIPTPQGRRRGSCETSAVLAKSSC